MTKKEEEKEIDRSKLGSEERGETGGKEAGGAGESGGSPSGESGGEGGGSGGTQGGSGGTQGGSAGGGEGIDGSEGNDSKVNLLQRIRNKRTNGLNPISGSTDGASLGNQQGDSAGDKGNKRGVKTDLGASPRNDRDNGRGVEQNGGSNGGVDSLTQGNERNERLKNLDKPQGVKIKGADKIKELAQKAAQASKVEAPKLKFTWDEKPLSNKEGDEMQPKIRALLEFIFRHMDKGISISNRNKAEAYIWRGIDNEDIEIIAAHLVEMGKASKVVATAVRRMTNSYRLLQIGLITLPKFIQTYQFYADNGGFALMGAPAKIQPQ